MTTPSLEDFNKNCLDDSTTDSVYLAYITWLVTDKNQKKARACELLVQLKNINDWVLSTTRSVTIVSYDLEPSHSASEDIQSVLNEPLKNLYKTIDEDIILKKTKLWAPISTVAALLTLTLGIGLSSLTIITMPLFAIGAPLEVFIAAPIVSFFVPFILLKVIQGIEILINRYSDPIDESLSNQEVATQKREIDSRLCKDIFGENNPTERNLSLVEITTSALLTTHYNQSTFTPQVENINVDQEVDLEILRKNYNGISSRGV